jgi:glycopeptide antibiotics resistance protein
MRIEFLPYPFLIGLGLLAVLLPIAWLWKRNASYLSFFGLFWLYLMLLVGITIFPLPIPLDMGGTIPRQPLAEILERINLVPFRHTGLGYFDLRYISFDLVGNILLTIPFGFGLSFVARIRGIHYLWLAFIVGLTIETSQLLVSLIVGFGYRGVDITDVLTNAAGVLIGYAFFCIFAWVYRTAVRLLRIQPSGLFAFIYIVTR